MHNERRRGVLPLDTYLRIFKASRTLFTACRLKLFKKKSPIQIKTNYRSAFSLSQQCSTFLRLLLLHPVLALGTKNSPDFMAPEPQITLFYASGRRGEAITCRSYKTPHRERLDKSSDEEKCSFYLLSCHSLFS